MRLFSIAFGTSELAVATVLATYMAGLALGASLAGRYISTIRRPVLVYGLLELGIAISATAVPFLLVTARQLLVAIIGGQPAPPDAGGTIQALFFLGSTFLILLVPTGMMGATLPLLTRFCVHTPEQVGRRTGYLYSINTAGAVLGTLTAGFLLLPRIGLAGTVYVGVIVNAFVFVLTLLLIRSVNQRESVTSATLFTESDSSKVPQRDQPQVTSRSRVILVLMLASGFVSFTYEVLWTRLLGHLMGGSVSAFATMLAGFLSGIAIGSAIAARIARSRKAAVVGFVIAQVGTALLSIAIYLALDHLPALVAQFSDDIRMTLGAKAGLSFFILLPATLCIGATFPFAVQIITRNVAEAGEASARVYAWNTLGAISGAVLAGFVLVPTLEFASTAKLAVGFNLTIALIAAWLLLRESSRPSIVLAALLFFAMLLFRPSAPENLMRVSSFSRIPARGEMLFSAVGRSATVTLLKSDGQYELRNNGLPEAGVFAKGFPLINVHPSHWQSALPVVARPNAESMLIIGFGGGGTIEGVPPSVQSIDVIELEPEMIAANRRIAPLRRHDPLSDPRVRLIINDARGALSLTNKKYDIIISQPSHPWTAGASHLFTSEFFTQIKSHLNPGGIFVQWMTVNVVDETLIKTLAATVLDVFEYSRLYRPHPSTLLFLSSNEQIDPERQLAWSGEPLESVRAHYSRMGIYGVEELCHALAANQSGLKVLADRAPVNTDRFNRFAMQDSNSARPSLTVELLDELLRPHDPLVEPDSELFNGSAPAVDAARLASTLVSHGNYPRAQRVAVAHLNEVDRFYIEGRILAFRGDHQRSRNTYQHVLSLAPDHAGALFEFLLPLATHQPRPPEVSEALKSLPDPEKAVIEQLPNAVAGRWDEVARADERLAKGLPGREYSVYVTRLRAGWRVTLEDAQLGKQRAREAIDIIDESVHEDLDVVCLRQRFLAAVILDRPEIQVETASVLAQAIGYYGPATSSLTATNISDVRFNAPVVLPRLSQLLTDSRVERDRVEEVAEKFLHLLKLTKTQQTRFPN
ncbi:MAG: fused MFS/spermidine synthase [Planctomycetaceae bacterium]|nr:fused MFS/spermidine synthase [Planctomycetaceae bacterium]